METRIYHGDISTRDFARALIANFNHGNLRAQRLGRGKKTAVQIATHDKPASGGQTALTVSLEQVEDGVAVEIGEQSWLGVAASIGTTALTVWRNPWGLIYRLDDLAQDINHLQLTEKVWEVIENVARSANAYYELSERLRRVVCAYCDTPNPVGGASCVACGAPLGEVQPITCKNCGYAVKDNETVCPNCGKDINIQTKK